MPTGKPEEVLKKIARLAAMALATSKKDDFSPLDKLQNKFQNADPFLYEQIAVFCKTAKTYHEGTSYSKEDIKLLNEKTDNTAYSPIGDTHIKNHEIYGILQRFNFLHTDYDNKSKKDSGYKNYLEGVDSSNIHLTTLTVDPVMIQPSAPPLPLTLTTGEKVLKKIFRLAAEAVLAGSSTEEGKDKFDTFLEKFQDVPDYLKVRLEYFRIAAETELGIPGTVPEELDKLANTPDYANLLFEETSTDFKPFEHFTHVISRYKNISTNAEKQAEHIELEKYINGIDPNANSLKTIKKEDIVSSIPTVSAPPNGGTGLNVPSDEPILSGSFPISNIPDKGLISNIKNYYEKYIRLQESSHPGIISMNKDFSIKDNTITATVFNKDGGNATNKIIVTNGQHYTSDVTGYDRIVFEQMVRMAMISAKDANIKLEPNVGKNTHNINDAKTIIIRVKKELLSILSEQKDLVEGADHINRGPP